MKGKKYGLTVPGQANQQARPNPMASSKMKKPSIFQQNSSESEGEEAGSDWVKQSLKVKANNSGLKKQAKLQMSQALEEDPTVFQYDEVYDDLEKKKEVEKESKKEVDRKPKYVANLLKAADDRQKEFERRVERQVQKEREAEGDQFADKEKFVTSAYRKKMEEIAKQEEEEKRTAQIEAVLDVRKQNNMDGFYRHLYRQTMGEEKEQIESRKKKEQPELSEKEKAVKVKEQIQKIKIEEEETFENKPDTNDLTIKKIERKKEFRTKAAVESTDSESGSSSENDDETNAEEKDGTSAAQEKFEAKKSELRLQKEKRDKRKRKIEQDASSSESEEEVEVKKSKPSEHVEKSNDDDDEEPTIVVEEAPKVDIWKKRTVDDVFEAAVRRYWERKANREAGK